MQGGFGVATTEAGDEVNLVGLDGAFGGVGPMKVRKNVFGSNIRTMDRPR